MWFVAWGNRDRNFTVLLAYNNQPINGCSWCLMHSSLLCREGAGKDWSVLFWQLYGAALGYRIRYEQPQAVSGGGTVKGNLGKVMEAKNKAQHCLVFSICYVFLTPDSCRSHFRETLQLHTPSAGFCLNGSSAIQRLMRNCCRRWSISAVQSTLEHLLCILWLTGYFCSAVHAISSWKHYNVYAWPAQYMHRNN